MTPFLYPCQVSCDFVVPAHWNLLDFVGYVLIMILFLANQPQKFLSFHIKICTQLHENTECVPQNYSVRCWNSLMTKPECVHVILTFFQQNIFCNMIGCSYRWLHPVVTLLCVIEEFCYIGRGWTGGEVDCNTQLLVGKDAHKHCIALVC